MNHVYYAIKDFIATKLFENVCKCRQITSNHCCDKILIRFPHKSISKMELLQYWTFCAERLCCDQIYDIIIIIFEFRAKNVVVHFDVY